MTREEKLKFYHSSAWRHMQSYIMQRDHYECQECRKRLITSRGDTLPPAQRKINRATQVHHIIYLEDDPTRALDPDNLEAICDRCHNRIHNRMGQHLPKRKPKPKKIPERW